MNRFLVKMVLTAAVVLTTAAAAPAELVKGRVKAVAVPEQLFSLAVNQETVQVLAWDGATVWNGLTGFADLQLDEKLTVEFSQRGGTAFAAVVSRNKTAVPAGIKVVTLAGLSSPDLTLVDTRAVEFYDAGHLPGAISVPLARLEKRTFGLLPENKGSRLVFYDEGQGGESAGRAALLSAGAGYTDVAVFVEGTAGWTAAGKILAASTNFIRKINPVVIDIRSKELAATGHIERAVNYPFDALKEYFRFLPAEKSSPLVVYGSADSDAVAAAKIFRDMGYQRVTIYPGGVASWAEQAEALETGPAGSEISRGAKSHGGKLQAFDFEMALASTVMVEMVDVRSAAEQQGGSFPRAKKIPLVELSKRYAELDRNKIQVIFAADPARAEMAHDLLKAKGLRVNFLDGFVEFAKDGTYSLKKK